MPPTTWDLLPDSLDIVSGVLFSVYAHAHSACSAALRIAASVQTRLTGMPWFSTPRTGTGLGGNNATLGTGAYRARASTELQPQPQQVEEAGVEVETGAEAEAEAEASVNARLLDDSCPDPTISVLVWYRLVFVSFMGGLVHLPNIGAGPSLLTYACLLLLGYTSVQAMVTAVITGGLCCWCPFFIHAGVCVCVCASPPLPPSPPL